MSAARMQQTTRLTRSLLGLVASKSLAKTPDLLASVLGLLDLLSRSGLLGGQSEPGKAVLWLELLEVLDGVVDEAEAGALVASELSLQAEDHDALSLVDLVHLLAAIAVASRRPTDSAQKVRPQATPSSIQTAQMQSNTTDPQAQPRTRCPHHSTAHNQPQAQRTTHQSQHIKKSAISAHFTTKTHTNIKHYLSDLLLQLSLWDVGPARVDHVDHLRTHESRQRAG